MPNTKFIQSMDRFHFRQLERMARERGITVQELLRAVVIPDWMEGRRRARLHRLHMRRVRDRRHVRDQRTR